MLIVAFTFAVIFLVRDVQLLAMEDRSSYATRLVDYALVLLVGMAVFVTLTGGHPVWTERRFAMGAVAVQVFELLLSVTLRRYVGGWSAWIGSVLPSPAFLTSLCALAPVLLPNAEGEAAIGMVTAAWFIIAAGLATALCLTDHPWEDRKFASDFAMMTTCTAAIFVPFCFA